MDSLLNQVDERIQGQFAEALKRAEWKGDNPTEASVTFADGMSDASIFRLAQGFRQVLLTRVPGWAVTAMRLEYRQEDNKDDKGNEKAWEGLPHKFGRLPGVVENVREIARNLQGGVFRLPDHLTRFEADAESSFDVTIDDRCKEILLGDWFEEEEADRVLNPDHVVFTLQDTVAKAWLQFTIEKGTGYRSALDIERSAKRNGQKEAGAEPLGKSHALPWLYLDADFNPVTRVGFRLDTEGSQRKLIYTIETRPNRTPKEAFQIALASFAAIPASIQGETAP